MKFTATRAMKIGGKHVKKGADVKGLNKKQLDEAIRHGWIVGEQEDKANDDGGKKDT